MNYLLYLGVDATTCTLHFAEKSRYQWTLARANWTDNGHQLAMLDVKIDIFQHRFVEIVVVPREGAIFNDNWILCKSKIGNNYYQQWFRKNFCAYNY